MIHLMDLAQGLASDNPSGNVGVGSRVFRFHGQKEGCALVQ